MYNVNSKTLTSERRLTYLDGDIVDSPDDGGWYVVTSWVWRTEQEGKAGTAEGPTTGIYDTRDEAVEAAKDLCKEQEWTATIVSGEEPHDDMINFCILCIDMRNQCYGKGKDIATAKKQLIKAGGHLKDCNTFIAPPSVWVDGLGYQWTAKGGFSLFKI